MTDLPCSNKRKNNILIPLRQLYDEMYHDEIIDKNPLTRVKNLSLQTREPLPFTPDEVTSILNELQGQERNLIQFAFWTGPRTSELIALRWQDVDLEQNCIHVRVAKVRNHLKGTKTKSGERTITLQSQARDALLNQRTYTEKETVFHNPRHNKPWKDDQAIRKTVWIPALERAGIKYRNPYQTRHTFASTMLSRGGHHMQVAEEMGHKDWGQTRKSYGRYIPQKQGKS